MSVVLSVAFGLILWVIIWSTGHKPFDGGMLFLLIVLGGATIRTVLNLLPGNQASDDDQPDPAPFN